MVDKIESVGPYFNLREFELESNHIRQLIQYAGRSIISFQVLIQNEAFVGIFSCTKRGE